MEEFVVEKRQVVPLSNEGWRFLYSDFNLSKAETRYDRSWRILSAGWRIRLRQGKRTIEDRMAVDKNAVPSVCSSVGCVPSVDDDNDVDDIYIAPDWNC